MIADGFEQSSEKDEQQFVKIRIMCGPCSDTEVEQLVEALNTNKQVDAFSIANYSGDFRWIKRILEGARFRTNSNIADAGEASNPEKTAVT